MNNTTYSRWQIWIDTGGTFTDCLGIPPQSNTWQRAKVLSSGTLRGRVRSAEGMALRVEAAWWAENPELFVDYTLRRLRTDETTTITHTDPETQDLRLKNALSDWQAGEQIELTAHEEAPILATRLVTQTPLDTPLPPMDMRLGSTKGTNALLERKGAKVALLTTEGLEDALLIGDQRRPDLFALQVRKPSPLHQVALPVAERLDAQGNVLQKLTQATKDELLDSLRQQEVEAVAIALLHSYRNPDHETELRDFLSEHGYTYISTSAALHPAIKLVPRANTAVVNAYLAPVITDYLEAVRQKMPDGEARLRVMTSAGGLRDADFFHPKDSLLSGPAGGVVGAAHVAQLSGKQRVISFDMGGTSTDVSRYDGSFAYRYETEVGGTTLYSPSLDIHTIAAGGGSVCRFDGHRLHVGPESAGAAPGPACYGAGGPMTITDVNLLLGRLHPDNFGVPLHREAAEEAFREVQNQLREADEPHEEAEVLKGFLRIANESMAEVIRKISLQEGYDPGTYALVGFGGAGGMHACQVAELLGMDAVVVPFDAGLLSAVGMGYAQVERFATRQVLEPLSEVEAELSEWIESLQFEAQNALQSEGYAAESLQTETAQLFLRLSGQEHTLAVDYAPERDSAKAFREAYENVYEHWIEDRTIELESVKVKVATRPRELPEAAAVRAYTPEPEGYTERSYAAEGWEAIPYFRWENLRPGAEIRGAALLLNDTGTTYLPDHWTARLDGHANLIATPKAEAAESEHEITSEAARLALFTNRFRSLAREMGALLQRTAFSVNVKERLDFSCALLDAEGQLVANAPHIPVHLGSLGYCVRAVQAELDLQEGDVAITNHPGFGGSHLPDVTLIAAVFDDEGQRLGYVANRAHHAEIGGTRPASMPPDARSLEEEGVVIRPQLLVRGGKTDWENIKRVLTEEARYPSRMLDENLADLSAALAAIALGKRQLRTLAQTHGRERVAHFMKRLREQSAESIRRSLARFGDRERHGKQQLDDGSPLRVRIAVSEAEITVDFSGTAAQHSGNLNATPAIVSSAVMYVFRLLIEDELPLNDGMLQPVRLILPAGTLLNPEFPVNPAECPAVVGGNVETSQRLVDTLLQAFEVAACSYGSMNNLLFGNDRFGYYETIGGGVGATEGAAGADAVQQHMTNTRITDAEIMEFRYPVRLERFGIRPDSGGAGQWRGGHGIIRQIRFLEPVSLTVLTQHRREAPYGMAGGAAGKCGAQYLLRKDGSREALGGIDGIELAAGEGILMCTPGGGGWGKEK